MKKNKKPKFIAIIPARGGSKRFPGKNIYPLCGKPLLSYPIGIAKKVKEIDRVIVSTDDPKIAAAAKKYGAEVPFMRPVELAGDTSPVVETMIYTVKRLEQEEGFHADYVILLQPTNPLVQPKHVAQAIKLAREKKADSVVAVAPLDVINHPYNIREILADGTIKFWQNKLHYEFLRKPRPKFYHVASIWISSYDTLDKNKKLEGKRNFPLIVDPIYTLDIDYKEDLELIEAWLEYKKKKQIK
jgi:N-acylneuraminate cytidylyltransferase/CMP-N,N'-diacetyllegionaminic acid synthase